RTPGVRWSRPPCGSASRRRASPRHWPTTTRCAPSGCPRRSCRASATTSARTRTAGWTRRACSTPSGRPRAAPNAPREVRTGVLRRLLPTWRQPARIVVVGFALAAACGTVLLALPASSESGEATGFVTALFTSISALCVTGLIVVDTPEYWSTFGELVILGLIQLGGLGIMTTASLLGLLVSRRFGL